jgi:hypothetical protein
MRLNKKAISWGILAGFLVSLLTIVVIIRNGEINDSNVWRVTISIIIISICSYFTIGLVTGVLAGYKGNAHSAWAVFIFGLIGLIINLILGYMPYGWGTSLLVAILIGIVGGNIGVKLHRRVDICPKCYNPTIIKTALKGKYKGDKFHVCSNYPQCKGRIKS